MVEQKCPICHEKRMDKTLSISRAQKLSNSPWFYAIYCKACGHVDGVFAQDVFTIKPRAPFSMPSPDGLFPLQHSPRVLHDPERPGWGYRKEEKGCGPCWGFLRPCLSTTVL